MVRDLFGWFLTVTGFVACPCRFPISLALVGGLLGGSAGAFLASHMGWVYGLGALYFFGGLIGGLSLLGRKAPSQSCPPGESHPAKPLRYQR